MSNRKQDKKKAERRALPVPRLGDKVCVRCNLSEAACLGCDQIHRCLARLIVVGPHSELLRRRAPQ